MPILPFLCLLACSNVLIFLKVYYRLTRDQNETIFWFVYENLLRFPPE